MVDVHWQIIVRVSRTSTAHVEQLTLNWDSIISNWNESIDKLIDKHSVLSFYTVNDMRFICNEISEYLVTGNGSKKQSLVTNITNKLSFINRTMNSEDVVMFWMKCKSWNTNTSKLMMTLRMSTMMMHLVVWGMY